MATMVTMRNSAEVHSSNQKRQPSATQSLNLREFTFANQSRFNAGQDLVLTRSDSYVIRKPIKEDDIWTRPPPDFRPQQYLPKPPKRNSRDSMQPWKYGTFPGQKKTSGKPSGAKALQLPKILQPERPQSSKIITRFKTLDPHEARVQFVKEGMYTKEQYQLPVKHDFRGYPPLGPLGLPEFVTASDHDPYDIKFKSNNRDIIVGLPKPRSERSMGLQIGSQAMSPKPHYQPELIMPNLKWPTVSGEFTRFRRRNRSPHTVLFDQIEDTLDDQWRNNTEERECIQIEMEREKRARQFQEEVARQLAIRTQMMSASTVHTNREVGGMGGQMSGQMGGQMSGQMGGQMSGQTGRQMSGQMGRQMSGQTGRQMSGQTGRQMSGQTGRQMSGQMGRQMSGQESMYSGNTNQGSALEVQRMGSHRNEGGRTYSNIIPSLPDDYELDVS